jgi:hypothetical protein
VQEQPRAGDAGLALVVEDGEGAALDGRGQVGVVEDDVGALAAQLQLEALEVAGRGPHDLAPTSVEPVNDSLATPGARPAGPGDVAEAGHDVDHPGREAGLGDQLGHGRVDSGSARPA